MGGGLAAANLATNLEELEDRVLTQEMRSPVRRMEDPEIGNEVPKKSQPNANTTGPRAKP